MSDLLFSIKQVCSVVAFHADRLDLLRFDTSDADARARSYLAAEGPHSAYRAISPWYLLVEALYAELETLMQRADDATSHAILQDPSILALLPQLHRIRAAYEFDKELAEARSLLQADHPGRALADLTHHQRYWTLPDPVARALQGAKHIAVVGSGPLPLTALAIADHLDCSITCFERDETAFNIGNDVLALSPLSEKITCLKKGTTSHDSFGEFDAIFTAVLMGVSLDQQEAHWPKSKSIEAFFSTARPNMKVIMRDPFRLGQLFYPAASTSAINGITVQRFNPEAGPGIPYRSSFLILEQGGA
ncbi:MAG: nicotianamine synthase family protein [Pseudomonadota bacterium]